MSERIGPSFPATFNISDYFLDDRIREGSGERVAVRVGDDQWTYRGVQQMANRCCEALRSRGIDIEDRVLLLLHDGIEFVASWFGLLKAGAVFCMANPLDGRESLEYLLEYTRARAVIADASVLPNLIPALERNQRCKVRLVVRGGLENPAGAGFENWEDVLLQSREATENAQTSRDDVAGWLFTSGTTGKPKGAVHLHHDFAYNTECYPTHVLKLTPDDVFLSVSRLFFGYATGTNLMFPFRFGGTAVYVRDKPTPELLFSEILRHKVTVLTNVPAMIRQMVDHDAAPRAQLGSLRMCLSAGEALPAHLYERWRSQGWCEILDGIGSAELFHIYISNAPGDVKVGSLGRLVPGYEARIVDANGEPVSDGEVGRLQVRGDSAAICYWRDHEKTKETFLGGDWVASADMFRRDAEGYYWYSGRGDDLLKVRGMFVSPLEIEECLSTHPAVRECCVVGVADADGMTIPKAVVVLHEGWEPSDATTQSLQQYAKANLARYKYPHLLSFVDELPRNDRGKVLRREAASL